MIWKCHMMSCLRGTLLIRSRKLEKIDKWSSIHRDSQHWCMSHLRWAVCGWTSFEICGLGCTGLTESVNKPQQVKTLQLMAFWKKLIMLKRERLHLFESEMNQFHAFSVYGSIYQFCVHRISRTEAMMNGTNPSKKDMPSSKTSRYLYSDTQWWSSTHLGSI